MTVHIALGGPRCGVLLSDSQTSTHNAAFHGAQKIVAGPGFLLGGAGRMDLISLVFASIPLTATGSADLATFVEDLLETEVRADARAGVQFILVSPCPETGAAQVRTYFPAVYRHFGPPMSTGALGSGIEFIQHAQRREFALGVSRPLDNIVEMLLFAEDFARASHDSLTVDDRYVIGLLLDEMTYLLGDSTIELRHCSPSLRKAWPEACSRTADILARLAMARGEVREQTRQFSALRNGTLTQVQLDGFTVANSTVNELRLGLVERLQDYVRWYDNVVRAPA